MLDVEVSASRRSSLFGLVRNLQIDARAKASSAEPPIPVGRLLHELSGLIAPLLEIAPLPRDLRGRPPETLPAAVRQPLMRGGQPEEELLYCTGKLLDLPGIGQPNLREPGTTDVSYRITTRFAEFNGAQHITYKRERIAEGFPGVVRRLVSMQLLAAAVPLRIEQLRVGFESFRARSFRSSLGMVPSVESRFYLECNADELKISASRDYGRGDPPHLPFAELDLLPKLDAALAELGLVHGLLERMNREVAAR